MAITGDKCRTWFTGLWEPRLGPEGAELIYKCALWRRRGFSILIAEAVFGVVLPRALGWPFAVPVLLALSFFVSSLYCLTMIRRLQAAAQRAAANFVSFDGDPRVIPVTASARFDRWLAQVRRSL